MNYNDRHDLAQEERIQQQFAKSLNKTAERLEGQKKAEQQQQKK